MNFELAFERLLEHEGGYSNHPNDPGGETMFGITLRVARRNGYAGAMRDLSIELADKIAREEYWNTVRADELPDAVRFDVFDTAYNSGPNRSIKLLQKACRVKDDGILGPITLTAARKMDPQKLAKRFNGERLEFMAGLGAWSSFSRGWARRLARNMKDD
jgi:lysozyme family protein